MNKKGNYIFYIFTSLIFLMIAGFIFMFINLFVYDIGDQYVLANVENATLTAGEIMNISNTSSTLITEARENYQDVSLPFDLFFIGALLVLFIGNITASFKARKTGIISFLGLMAVGLLFLMGLIAIIEPIRVWLFDTFIYALFDTSVINTPFIDAIYNNFGLVAFIWIVVCLLVNQLDIDILDRNSGRFEE